MGSLKCARLCLLLAVFACLMGAYESMRFPGAAKSKTAEEKAEEERLNAAKIAYKRLFVRSQKLSEEVVIESLKAMDAYYGNPKMDMPLDVRELMAIRESSEEKCDNAAYMERLSYLRKLTKRRYPGLSGYVNFAFENQAAMCNFEDRFKRQLDSFREGEPEKWQLIQDYYYFVGECGGRDYRVTQN